jgi:hypothetical protein
MKNSKGLTMDDQIIEQIEKLVGGKTKLADLKANGHGYDPKVGSWGLAWSHYVFAGDARTAPNFDPGGNIDIKGHKLGPNNTVSDLMSVLKK